MVNAADTGAWSRYSWAGREATLGYHQLIEAFLGAMCTQTKRAIYCTARHRFARYEREPTRIGIAPLRKLRARGTTTVRFSLSKVSTVTVRVTGAQNVTLTSGLQLPHGAHTIAWTPPARGRYRVLISAQGPSGPLGVSSRKVHVVLPKPKPKKKPCKRTPKSEKRCHAKRQLTSRWESEKVGK